jgi:hypothetical protein
VESTLSGQRAAFNTHLRSGKCEAPSSAARHPGFNRRPDIGLRGLSLDCRPQGCEPAWNRPGRDSAFGNVQPGRMANRDAARGRASLGGGGGLAGGGGGGRVGGGAIAAGGGGGLRGGGRRSDIRLKHDVTLLVRLDNGLSFYRFSYIGSDKAYVGVMAQEVQRVMPEAVVRGRDGYLRVYYDRLGVPFETYDRWIASGAQIPTSQIVHGTPVDAGGDRGAGQNVNARYQNN